MNNNKKEIIVVAGPTGSGKSQIAIEMALGCNGTIINSDCLQIFEDLPILTAHPLEHDKNLVQHKLYGILKYSDQINAAKWAKLAALCINEAAISGKTPILVGGNGMYIKTLIDGISDIPEVSREIRKTAASTNYRNLCDYVYNSDPHLKNIIKTSQHRQMTRAYEILLATGKSIRYFFEQPKKKFINSRVKIYIIDIKREQLYCNINTRFKQMMDDGAIEEVQDLLAKTNGRVDYQVFQAIGAIEICNYLKGLCSLNDVITISSMNSRRYAKRQLTFLKNQIKTCDANIIPIHI